MSLHESSGIAKYIIHNNTNKILHSRSVSTIGLLKTERKLREWKKKLGEYFVFWTSKILRRNKYRYNYIYFITKAKRRIVKLVYNKLKYYLRKKKKTIKRLKKEKNILKSKILITLPHPRSLINNIKNTKINTIISKYRIYSYINLYKIREKNPKNIVDIYRVYHKIYNKKYNIEKKKKRKIKKRKKNKILFKKVIKKHKK